jgi:hypothetical protein
MNGITGGTYSNWIATLPEADRQILVDAGIDGELQESLGHYNEIQELDGHSIYRINGSNHVQHFETCEDDTTSNMNLELASALRATLQWIVGGLTTKQLFKRPLTAALKIYCLGRILRLNDFAETTMSEAAQHAGLTRACVSKISCNLRDAIGEKYFTAPGDRQEHRGLCRRTTIRSWEKRRKKDEIFPDNS